MPLSAERVSRVTAGSSFYKLVRAVLFRSPSSLLDLGCGNGAVVHAAAAAGVSAVGIDTDSRAIEMASTGPGEFICADLRDTKVAQSRYEVVTLFDVIEHFVDPAAVLQSAIARVGLGGMILITTPNLDGWLRVEQGELYYHYSDDHEVLFGVEALHLLMARCGISKPQVVDLGDTLRRVGGPEDWYAIAKYTKYRSHLLGIGRLR